MRVCACVCVCVPRRLSKADCVDCVVVVVVVVAAGAVLFLFVLFDVCGLRGIVRTCVCACVKILHGRNGTRLKEVGQ